MNKSILFWLILAPCLALADAKTEALESLKRFNPASVLKDYTANPNESGLMPPEGSDTLKTNGLSAIYKDQTASSVFEQAKIRPRVKNNANSVEMRYAEKLIENADGVLEGSCYTTPASCHAENTLKTCEEFLTYQPSFCGERLTIQLKTHTDAVKRLGLMQNPTKTYSFDLTRCSQGERCDRSQLLLFDKQCAKLTVEVRQRGRLLPILKAPTCLDPTIVVQLPLSGGQYFSLKITANQQIFEESWQKNDCSEYEHKIKEGLCAEEASNVCTEANQTKIIEGIPFTRPCWGKETRYRCVDGLKSTCDALLKDGCSQVNSICSAMTTSHCTHFLQTFQCPIKVCMPEQTLCPGKIACADGSCDKSQMEESNDINEGISRLAALTGAAEDFSNAQASTEYQPSVFAGNAMSCQKYPLGLRDCCKDKGWGDWIVHCPKALQALLKARHENRAVYLGKYKKESKNNHVYCVFPTQLAAIVQIQGRGGQLHIPFGEPKEPSCRGLSAKELEAINFARLDLSPLTEALRAKIQNPLPEASAANNQSHIERLNQQGKAHD